ncbi:hypothetical protein [Sinorhizobium meliloti]|uniref:hypothetical protein n=1 Tax=Rhizobium meliloti TaxID=382 RepID=UPI00299F4F22|nr:hypothetical protein [Sinorhizobium meliloti]
MKKITLRIDDCVYEFAAWAAEQRGYGSPEHYLSVMLAGAVLDDKHTPEEDGKKPRASPATDLDDGIPF